MSQEVNTKQKTDAEIMTSVLDALDRTAANVAGRLGVTPGAIYHVRNGMNDLSDALIDKMVKEFPSLNYVYLKTGTGEIFHKNPKMQQAQENIFNDRQTTLEDFANIPKTLEEIRNILVDIYEVLKEK